MKIGIISDIHANIYGLKAVLNKLEGVDMILCAGDIIGYYTFVNEVFEEIKAKNISCILGNHDAYLTGDLDLPPNPISHLPLFYAKNHINHENLKFLKGLSKNGNEMEIGGLKIKMYHGSPWNELEEYIYPDFKNFDKFKEIKADVVILGHTHWPMVKKIGDLLIINPGSCGQPRDYNSAASFAILDTETKEAVIQRAEYDIDKVGEAARKEGFDEKLAGMLRRTRKL